jgi:hypothetical protein
MQEKMSALDMLLTINAAIDEGLNVAPSQLRAR